MVEIRSKVISPAALSAILSDGTPQELLDVRTPSEYASVHVPGARLAPLDQLDAGAVLARHRDGRPIYVICQAGMRASQAIERFQRAGCGDCVLVEGGTQAWIAAGLPVHRGARRVLPLLRQVQIVVGSLSAAGAILAFTVTPWFAFLPLLVGCGLLVAGITGTCGMALVLARMPWNRGHQNPACCTQE